MKAEEEYLKEKEIINSVFVCVKRRFLEPKHIEITNNSDIKKVLLSELLEGFAKPIQQELERWKYLYQEKSVPIEDFDKAKEREAIKFRIWEMKQIFPKLDIAKYQRLYKKEYIEFKEDEKQKEASPRNT